MKFKELITELEQLGYVWVRANGGHQIYRHPLANRPMIVPYDNRELGPKIVSRTLKSAAKAIQAGTIQKRA